MSQGLAGTPPGSVVLHEMFELQCADVYPVRCDEVIRSASRDELLARTREHGGRAHGFTSTWHSAGRLAAMAEAVRSR